MPDPGRAWEHLDAAAGDESWTEVYRRNGVDPAYGEADDREDDPRISVEVPETCASGTATPGNDMYDPSLDTTRFRQTAAQRVQDPFHYDSAFSW